MDETLNLIESVTEGFPTYSYISPHFDDVFACSHNHVKYDKYIRQTQYLMGELAKFLKPKFIDFVHVQYVVSHGKLG